jgi:hypothetical protein
MTFGYTGFWHITLYYLKYASRPFIKNRPYNVQKLFHNMSWTFSGVLIWTIFENIFCYLWATNRLAYINNFISFNTTEGKIKFILALIGVPLWRSFHFYFAHRLLHFGPLYQHVHSLHHRNTDIEPFSGLCMHPVEHLYYYSCVLPSVVFICSPFALLWNGAHLLLSPAASHSVWEDHFQSDSFHYMHHRYFECNYAGLDAAFLDLLFGTFQETFNEKFDDEGPKHREDAKSTLLSYPTDDFLRYIILSLLYGIVWLFFAFRIYQNKIILTPIQQIFIASLVGFGPIIIAWVLTFIYGSGFRTKPIKMGMIGNAVHLIGGSLFCSIPITYICMLALKN